MRHHLGANELISVEEAAQDPVEGTQASPGYGFGAGVGAGGSGTSV